MCGQPDQSASTGKYLPDSELDTTLTDAEKTALKNTFDDMKARDFSEYPYRVYTNLVGLTAPDPTKVNIY